MSSKQQVQQAAVLEGIEPRLDLGQGYKLQSKTCLQCHVPALSGYNVRPALDGDHLCQECRRELDAILLDASQHNP